MATQFRASWTRNSTGQSGAAPWYARAFAPLGSASGPSQCGPTQHGQGRAVELCLSAKRTSFFLPQSVKVDSILLTDQFFDTDAVITLYRNDLASRYYGSVDNEICVIIYVLIQFDD